MRSGEIEQQHFAASVAGTGHRQHVLVADRGAIALAEQLAVERCLTAHDLHPGMPASRERVLHGVTGAEIGDIQLRVLVDGRRRVAPAARRSGQQAEPPA